jgi:nicotinate-nucleotide adenylyltransferase
MTVVFGGAFNPPHIGHRVVAETAYELLKPDNFLIVPTFISPHKESSNIAAYEKRMEWCKKTFPRERFFVSDIESTLDGRSYTYNTVNKLLLSYSDLYLLIGEDSFLSFNSWYMADELYKLCKLVVYPRYFDERGFSGCNRQFIKLESPIIEISSSSIRKSLSLGRNVYGMVDDAIYNEIKVNYK